MAQELINYDPKKDIVTQAKSYVADCDDIPILVKRDSLADTARKLSKKARQPKEQQNYYFACAAYTRRKIGQLLGPLIRHQGGRPGENTDKVSELGLHEKESERWQRRR